VTFDLYAGGVLAGRFLSPLPGLHNLRNAVAALAAAAQGYGADVRALGVPLAEFRGIKRRQELLGTPGGVFVYDDFAHHPTAVRETLAALRGRHAEGRLFAVFEPRSATACRRVHQLDYESAFDSADVVLLAKVHRTDIHAAEQLDVSALAGALLARELRALTPPGTQEILERLRAELRPGDVVAILSNGAFDGLQGRLLAALAGAPGS
jgi:UDP-N-acetylmuramate: L-alanyl-gamma-D-glutamyl-meso-diaminopimelate ligase